MDTKYADFSSLGPGGQQLAEKICEDLKPGDTVVLDERVLKNLGSGCAYKFLERHYCFIYRGYENDLDLRLQKILDTSSTLKVTSVDGHDKSISIKDGWDDLWISWAMVDFKKTASINHMELDFLECEYEDESLQKIKELEEENKKLKKEIAKLTTRLLISNECILGSVWTLDQDYYVAEAQVVQINTVDLMLIDKKTYNRYYNETFSRDNIVDQLLERGWELKVEDTGK